MSMPQHTNNNDKLEMAPEMLTSEDKNSETETPRRQLGGNKRGVCFVGTLLLVAAAAIGTSVTWSQSEQQQQVEPQIAFATINEEDAAKHDERRKLESSVSMSIQITPMPTVSAAPTVSSMPSVSPAPSDMPSVSHMPSVSAAPSEAPTISSMPSVQPTNFPTQTPRSVTLPPISPSPTDTPTTPLPTPFPTTKTPTAQPVVIPVPYQAVYFIAYQTSDEIFGCETVEPEMTASCGPNGRLVIMEHPEENHDCSNTNDNTITCAAQEELYIQLRCESMGTQSSFNTADMQLTVTLPSDTYECDACTDDNCDIYLASMQGTAYQRLFVFTGCESGFYTLGDSCSGTLQTDNSNNRYCETRVGCTIADFGDTCDATLRANTVTAALQSQFFGRCVHVVPQK